MADAATPTADCEQEVAVAAAAAPPATAAAAEPVAELVPQNPPTSPTAVMGSSGDNSAQGAQPSAMRCCCGREDCVYLRHNCTLLKSVERDVHTAAKMGQVNCTMLEWSEKTPATHSKWRARQPRPEECFSSLTFSLQTLLIRHEAYMAAAERDRAELTARIEQLERENAELEEKNRETIHENYSLHAELESLNDTVREADTRIDYLETTLRESQREIRRLELAAERAATLEKQLSMLEEEQATLQATLVNTQEEARTAITRWKQAEKGINDLQEQLERMEKEAKEERERHAEVIGRIEKQREMEKELSTAAGRLKGAAAVKSLSDTKSTRNVVSHFVRDLLQDNANLQLGIAELREMLMNSHDEIQLLREQIHYHQPSSSDPKQLGTVSTLQTEFDDPDSAKTPKISQAVHVHHHYHIAQKGESRKQKKNRRSMTSGTFSPPHIISAPTTPVSSQNPQWQAGRGLGPPFIPRHSAHDSTSTAAGRWSLISEMPSEFAPSSAPTSPQSNPRRNSVFDRGIIEVSVPNSPTTSVDPTSPEWNRKSHRRQASQWSTRSTAMHNSGTCSPPYPGHRSLAGLVLAEELNQAMGAYTTDDVPDMAHGVSSAEDDTVETMSANGDVDDPEIVTDDTIHRDLDFHPEAAEQRTGGLRRMTSHESIMSLSNGLDIHTLKVRPSQLTLRPLGLSAAGTGISNVTAMPTISARGSRGSMHARDNLALVGQRLPRPVSTSQNNKRPSVAEPPFFLNPNRRAHTDGLHMSSSVRSTASRQLSLPTLGRLVSWRPWSQSSSQPTTAIDAAPGTGRTGLEPTPELPEPTPTPFGTGSTGTGTGLGIAIAASDGKSSYRSVSSSTTTGTAGTATTTTTTPLSSSLRSVSSATTGTTIKPRAPGINQPGVIPGFLSRKGGLPSKVTVEALDVSQLGSIEEALREGI
ncbi:uncharacterized protein B0T23DRAFT_367187 [Neurospora hispaniola]|uniref:Uncharacterized protein n=1 Tax=Neurospora hispaniola TaxID=588809 RepID=A0AAJ0HYG9_9PEZI|nr:hypothetical protein B0T23DRAFT_367187 [Neurospora hispaniola]